MKGRNRQQLLVIAAIAVVSIFFGDRLIVAPLIQAWKDRSARIARLTESIAQGNVLLDRERAIQERWNSFQTNSLPVDTSKAQDQVLSALNKWEQESGIRFSGLKPQWKRNADEYTTLDCRADTFGSMEAVTKFLYNLERDPIPVKIEEMELTSRDDNGQQLLLVLRVSGLVIGTEEEQR